MTVLVFGKDGQVGHELVPRLAGARFVGRAEADLADPAACAALIERLRPSAVINAAAYTAVDKAEAEPEAARLVNAAAPGAMAAACARLGAPFLHFSTDYVFDGSGTAARAEDAPVAPLGVYGRTKREGEREIAAAGGQWAVMRTSWVFGAHGHNFVKTIRRLGAQRPRLTIVADQVGGPTPAAAIAEAAAVMIGAMAADRTRGGLYHFAGAPDVSWADFARAILQRSGLPAEVEDIPTSAYPTPARRPANSRLDCAAIGRDFGIARPDWRAGLDDVIRALST